MMDILNTLVAIETTLGANPQGVFGSLTARLNQFIPGSGGLPGLVTFSNAVTVNVPGTMHNVGQAALLWQLYDTSIPAHAMAPGSVSVQVDPPTYDFSMTFASETSGLLALGATSPLYMAPFSNTTTVTIPGTTHQLGTADLLWQLYDNATPRRNAIQPGAMTVDATTRTVVFSFLTPTSGLAVLSAGGPTYATNFTLTTPPYTFTIPGILHMLGTPAILFKFYDNGTPRAAVGDPQVTVNPTTFDTVVTFGAPLSGRVVLGAAAMITGRDFDIRDAGVVNTSAVRLRSNSGNAYVQAGAGQHIYFQDALGTTKAVLDTLQTRLGIGTLVPSQQLELTGNAAKPGGGAWLASSDDRQKEGVQAFEEGLETLLQMQAIRYRYNGQGGIPRSPEEHIGLSAQALQALAPYMVRSRTGRLVPGGPETDLLSVDVSALPYLLMNAVKTVYTMVMDGLDVQRRLQGDVTALQTRVQQLEERLV